VIKLHHRHTSRSVAAEISKEFVGNDWGCAKSDICNEERMTAIVGCSKSDISTVLVPIVNAFDVPVISAMSNQLSLNDRTRYPYFMRIISTDVSLVKCFAAFVDKFEWKHIWAIVVDSTRFMELLHNLERKTKESLDVVWDRTYVQSNLAKGYETPELINGTVLNDKLRTSWLKDPRIIVTIGAYFPVYIALYELGLLDASHSVLSIPCQQNCATCKGWPSRYESYPNDFPTNPFWRHNASTMNKALVGLVTFCTDSFGKRSQSLALDELWKSVGSQHNRRRAVFYSVRQGGEGQESFRRRLGLRSSDFNSGIVGHQKYKSSFPRRFDAMTVIIYAIADMLHDGHKPATIRGNDLYEKMKRQKFEGLAGKVQFDAKGEWDDSVAIFNIGTDEFWHKAANFSDSRIHMEHGQTFIWPGNISTIPSGSPEACGGGHEHRACQPLDGYSGVSMHENDPCQDYLLPNQQREQLRWCTPCAAGRFVSAGQAASMSGCLPCKPGFLSKSGSARCEPCGAGSIADANGTACVLCKAGKFVELTGQAKCEECKPGFYTKDQGQKAPARCPPGSYSDMKSAVKCSRCPSEWTTFPDSSLTSLGECVCPAGKYWPGANHRASLACIECPDGMSCPGGHSYLSRNVSDRDVTPRLENGYMSLSSDMYSVFECTRKATCMQPCAPSKSCATEFTLRCMPHNRSCEESMCADMFGGVRCALCPTGRYSECVSDDCKCQDCNQSSNPLDGYWQVLVLYLVQLMTWVWLYKQGGRDTLDIQLVGGALLVFLQVLSTIFAMQLDWPPSLAWIMNLSGPASIQGLLETMSVRPGCLFGASIFGRAIREALVPLLPFLNGALCSVFGLMVYRPLSQPYVKNTIGEIFGGLFISISRTALLFFPCDDMPNGTCFLQSMQDVQLGSKRWWESAPVSLVAVTVYCGGFFAYVVRAIFQAPQRASKGDFMKTYDFIFADIRHDCYWWLMAQLTYRFCIVLVMSFAQNSQSKLYLFSGIQLVFSAATFIMQPNVSANANVLDMCLQLSLLWTLILATSFFKVDPIGIKELVGVRNACANCIAVILSMAVLVGLVFFANWVRSLTWAAGTKVGKQVRVAYGARDVMASLNLLTERDFMARSCHLCTADLHLLQQCTNMVVSEYLHYQPCSSRLQQRVKPEAKTFKIWSNEKAANTLFAAAEEGTLQDVTTENMILRQKVRKLAKELGPLDSLAHFKSLDTFPSVSNVAAQAAAKLKQLKPVASLKQKSLTASLGTLSYHTGHGQEYTSDEFQKLLESHTTLTPAEIKQVFDIMDIDRSGTVSMIEFTEAIVSLAPGILDDENDTDIFQPIHNLETDDDEELIVTAARHSTLHVAPSDGHHATPASPRHRSQFQACTVTDQLTLVECKTLLCSHSDIAEVDIEELFSAMVDDGSGTISMLQLTTGLAVAAGRSREASKDHCAVDIHSWEPEVPGHSLTGELKALPPRFAI